MYNLLVYAYFYTKHDLNGLLEGVFPCIFFSSTLWHMGALCYGGGDMNCQYANSTLSKFINK